VVQPVSDCNQYETLSLYHISAHELSFSVYHYSLSDDNTNLFIWKTRVITVYEDEREMIEHMLANEVAKAINEGNGSSYEAHRS